MHSDAVATQTARLDASRRCRYFLHALHGGENMLTRAVEGCVYKILDHAVQRQGNWELLAEVRLKGSLLFMGINVVPSSL